MTRPVQRDEPGGGRGRARCVSYTTRRASRRPSTRTCWPDRELGGTFDLDRFEHEAFYNRAHGRIEMHLVSLMDQCVRIGKGQVPFRKGETILTEYSHKYSLDDFARLAASAGFAVEQVWTDDEHLFSVQNLVAR